MRHKENFEGDKKGLGLQPDNSTKPRNTMSVHIIGAIPVLVNSEE